jgi:hypothetical protein
MASGEVSCGIAASAIAQRLRGTGVDLACGDAGDAREAGLADAGAAEQGGDYMNA